jgi:hypothetical protein
MVSWLLFSLNWCFVDDDLVFLLSFIRCNAYNVSSACACLLCVVFGVSVFFDVKDLHASKVSPRTRT